MCISDPATLLPVCSRHFWFEEIWHLTRNCCSLKNCLSTSTSLCLSTVVNKSKLSASSCRAAMRAWKQNLVVSFRWQLAKLSDSPMEFNSAMVNIKATSNPRVASTCTVGACSDSSQGGPLSVPFNKAVSHQLWSISLETLQRKGTRLPTSKTPKAHECCKWMPTYGRKLAVGLHVPALECRLDENRFCTKDL